MELYLFRHGEKEKSKFFIGQTDVPLTPKGKQQNQRAFQRLLDLQVEKIFTSDLKRTFVPGGIKQSDLREVDFGLWEGLEWKTIEKKYPSEAAAYLTDSLNFCFPKGESYTIFRKRIVRWFQTLQQKDLKKIGLIAHEGVIKVFLSEYGSEDFWKVKIKYGHMVKLET